MVTSDGHSHLIRDGRDVQIAVHHNNLDVAVVFGGHGKVVRGQTHGIVIRIGALGFRLAAFLQCNVNGLVAHIRGVAGHALFAAVVHLAIVVTGDGHGHFIGVGGNGQLTLPRDDIIIGNFFSIRIGEGRGAGEFAGVFANVLALGGIAQTRPGIAVQQAFYLNAGKLLFVAVIRQGIALAGERHILGVIHGDDVLGGVGGNGDRLARGIRMHVRAFHAFCRRLRRQGLANLHGARLIRGHRNHGAQQIVVNGVLRGVQLEVQLQHQRTGGGNLAAQHVVAIFRVEDILRVLGLGLVVFGYADGFPRLGRTGCGQSIVDGVRAVGVLIIELHGVILLCSFPDGVQHVFAFAVHAGFRVGGEGSALAVGLGVPGDEFVASLCEGVLRNGDLVVIEKAGNGVFRLAVGQYAVVALIGDGDGVFLHAPDGVQGHVRGADGQLAVGINLGGGGFGIRAPAQEDFALGRGESVGGLHVRQRTLGVLLVVLGNVAGTAVGVIGHAIGRLAGNLGVQLVIPINLRFEVEGCAVLLHPAQEFISFGGVEILAYFILVILGRFAVFCVSFQTVLFAGMLVESNGIGGRFPLGIHGDVLGGHFLAGKDIRHFSIRVSIPACKGEAFRRIGKLIVPRFADVLLVLVGSLIYLNAIVNVNDLVFGPVVIELRAVIVCAIFSAALRVADKAGNIIAVFFGNGRTTAGSRVGMIQNVLAVQIRKIIISLGAALLGFKEFKAANGHYVDVGLGNAAVRRNFPGAAGPLLTDIRAVLGDNTILDNFLVLYILTAKTEKSAFPLNRPEGHGIHIALIVHVDDGGTVAGDGLLLNGLRREAGIALGGCGSFRTGSAIPGFAFHVGILVIIGIFLPVNHGIPGAGAGRPLCSGDRVSRQHGVKIEIPSVKGIAGPGGVGGLRGRLAVGHEHGRHIRAAVRIEGQPVARFHLGVQGHVGLIDGNHGHGVGKCRIGVPAGDGMVGFHGELHVRSGDLIAVGGFLGFNHAAGIVLKEHVIDFRVLSGDLDGLVLAGQSAHGAEGHLRIPLDELLVGLCGSGGLQQGIAVFYDLAGDRGRAVFIVKLVCIIRLIVRLYHQHADGARFPGHILHHLGDTGGGQCGERHHGHQQDCHESPEIEFHSVSS